VQASYTFGACLCKALLANWLVNLAVWIANAAQVGNQQMLREHLCSQLKALQVLAPVVFARQVMHTTWTKA
jgi:hypothetical protein